MKIVITESQFNLIKEGLIMNDDNRLHRDPSGKPTYNYIDLDGETIVDLSIGRVGDFEDEDGFRTNNGLEIIQMSSATQKRGHGTLAIKFIFDKLPKIQNIYIQCYPDACGFWSKIGGVVVKKRKTDRGNESTMLINRDKFFSLIKNPSN